MFPYTRAEELAPPTAGRQTSVPYDAILKPKPNPTQPDDKNTKRLFRQPSMSVPPPTPLSTS